MELNLVGGSGERPASPNDPPPEPQGFVLTAEMVAELPDDQLQNWYHDQLEYDTTRGANLRLLRRELKRRELI